MSTTNEHTDAGSRFWTSTEHGGPTDARPFEQSAESVHEDAASAFREAQGRSEQEAEISDDSIESLSHGFGGLKPALEYNVGMTKYYKANPLEAREKHLRDYATRFRPPMPERAPPAQPHPDLDERGLREWHLENDIREAIRNAPREQALKREREDAKELLAQAAAELGVSPGKLLEQTAAVDMAMQQSPQHVSTKLSRFFGAPASEAHANEIVAAAQGEQWTNGLMGQLEQAKQEGRYAGVERPVAEHMAEFFDHLARTGQHVDYNAAFSAAHEYATSQVQAAAYDVARRLPEVSNRYPELQTEEGRQGVAQVIRERGESSDWERDLHIGVETFRQRRRETAEKARHASKSVSGAAAPDYGGGDNDDGSIEAAARSAYRSLSTSGRV